MALEYLVGVALPDKLKQTAVALKALYDEDVIEEVHLFLPACVPSVLLSFSVHDCSVTTGNRTQMHLHAAIGTRHVQRAALPSASPM